MITALGSNTLFTSKIDKVIALGAVYYAKDKGDILLFKVYKRRLCILALVWNCFILRESSARERKRKRREKKRRSLVKEKSNKKKKYFQGRCN